MTIISTRKMVGSSLICQNCPAATARLADRSAIAAHLVRFPSHRVWDMCDASSIIEWRRTEDDWTDQSPL